jgi:uncharacterized protein (TIGR02996 family)
VSDTVTGLLRRALEAFERHEEEESLRRLLEAWRGVRAGRIAVLAERLTKWAHRSAPRVGLLGLPRLLDSIVEKVGQLPPARLGKELGGHTLWTADPRFTPGLLTLAALPAAYDGDLFRPLCELLILVKDPRSLEPLRALHAGLPDHSPYARRLGLVLSLIAQVEVPPLDTEASDLCDTLEEALSRREEGAARSLPLREELLARVGASPDDDGARLVLADHLLEEGDPLGELIMLQCQPQPDEARVARLLELHGAKWDSLLGPYVSAGETRFERGLPVSVRLEVPPWEKSVPPPGPFWSTVRELDLDWTGTEALADWLAHPHLRGLTVLLRVDADIARRLGPLPLRRLELRGGAAREGQDVFATLASLPHLRWVEVQDAEPDDIHLCAHSTLGPRLERFHAARRDSWSLAVTRSEAVPVEATLLSELHRVAMAEAIRAAAGFSLHGLRIRTRLRLAPDTVRMLNGASSGYLRVEWDLPPGSG